MNANARGITFQETMSGPFKMGATEPGAGAEEAGDSTLTMHASVSIDSMDDFVADEQHAGALAGNVALTGWDEPAVATDGVFNLFRPTDDPELTLMVYEMRLSHAGDEYYVAGRKEVRSDHHGADLWKDTTTLYTTLHQGGDKSGPIVGAGVLTLGVDDLARLVRTIRVTGSGSAAESAQTVAQFGQFFMGELWDTYGAPLVRPSWWRRLTSRLSRLFARLRG